MGNGNTFAYRTRRLDGWQRRVCFVRSFELRNFFPLNFVARIHFFNAIILSIILDIISIVWIIVSIINLLVVF